VERLSMNISVEELNSDIAEFQVDDWLDGTIDVVLGDTTSTAHFEATQISEDASLPVFSKPTIYPALSPMKDCACWMESVSRINSVLLRFLLQQGPCHARLSL
jgi:hypothetical protein